MEKNDNFWLKLQKPIMVLAPMADVTDAAFRRLIAKYGKPDVMWTEFVSADGLAMAPQEGRDKLLLDLRYTEGERPIVAQFFTSNTDHMRKAARLAAELGFDGIDINMGCPDRGVEKQGAGAALIKNPKRARELIRAAKEGAEEAARSLPVSVKTRIGYNKDEIGTTDGGWIAELLAEHPAVLTLHARTRKEMSKVPARWEAVKRVVEIRNKISPDTLIFGNGDARDVAHAKELAAESGADGVMLGRAIFGMPWLFAGHEPSVKEKLLVLIEHTKLFEELMTGAKNFAVMKKHFKVYVNGFDGASDLRMRLMEAENASEVEFVIKNFLASLR